MQRTWNCIVITHRNIISSSSTSSLAEERWKISKPDAGGAGWVAQLPLQIHHVHQLHSGLVDGVVIVVGEEIGDAVPADKAALLIKRHGQRTVAGAHL